MLAACLGVLAGVMCVFPILLLCIRAERHNPPSVAAGFLALIVSVIFGILVLTIGKNVLEWYFELFASALVTTFLLVVAALAWRSYKWMNSLGAKVKEANVQHGRVCSTSRRSE